MTKASAGQGILSTVGNTPLVRLERYFAPSPLKVFAKLECFNPGGSSKDRAALAILESGFREGEIASDTVVIESSSGNMGIGLAQVCRYYNLRFICVVDPKTTPANIKMLEAYGTEVDIVLEPDPVSGEFLQARLKNESSSWWVRFLIPSGPTSTRTPRTQSRTSERP